VSTPLFPLDTVLFPGGPLRLRIFEPRYLAMVSRCMREQHGFGVVLIDQGSEVSSASFVDTGTRAEIVDWSQDRDGLLQIVARGCERFAITRWYRQDDGLYVGELATLPAEPLSDLPDRFRPLRDLLERSLDDVGEWYAGVDRRLDDAAWIGYRLAELLPIPSATKQVLLELDDAHRRLEILQSYVQRAE